MKRILIIDDDLNMRETIREILSVENYEIVITADGKEGISLHRLRAFDLIITDIIMPDMDGIEIIIELKKNHKDTKIIAISGGGYYYADDYLETARALGANTVIEKPFENEELTNTVNNLLNS
jgi:CheY-like chemotaxis protein